MSERTGENRKRSSACIIVMLLLLPAASFAAQAVSLYEKYACPGNYFTALVPKEWGRTEQGHPYGDMTKVSGVKLSGPTSRDGAPVSLSLLYYSGEKHFTTSGAYISTELNSPVRIDYDEKKVPADIVIAGRRAVTFSLKTFELVILPGWHAPSRPEGDPRIYEIAPPSKQVTMVEKFIVIPGGKGFYVLHYRAPEDSAEEYQSVFEKVTGSFEMQIK